MGRNTFIVRPLRKWGPAYEVNESTYLVYQTIHFATLAVVILTGIVVIFAPNLADLVLPGTSANPLFPFIPLAIAALAIFPLTMIASRGRVLYGRDDPSETNIQTSKNAPTVKGVLRCIAFGAMAFITGRALIGEMTIEHKMHLEVLVGFLISAGGLIFFLGRVRQ
jgi:hypothetical protein